MSQQSNPMIQVINQHRNVIVALEAIIAATIKLSDVDTNVVKQKIRDSKSFGKQSPAVLAACEATALRILERT